MIDNDTGNPVYRLTEVRREVVLAFADCNMNLSEVGRKLYMHHNTVKYHLDRTKAITGIDPCNFYGLAELVKMIKCPPRKVNGGQIMPKIVCDDCGRFFEGSRSARFCPECRRRRQSEATKKRGLNKIGNAAHSKKAREKHGT